MSRSFQALKSYHLHASDGEIGRIDDFYFDDNSWKVRYLVVQMGSWLSGRKLLLSPDALGSIERQANTIVTGRTCAQVERAASDFTLPLSQSGENEASYGWISGEISPANWLAMGGSIPENDAAHNTLHNDQCLETTSLETTPFDTILLPYRAKEHLYNANDMQSYAVAGVDGTLGHIADFMVDSESDSWMLRHFLVRSGEWPTKRKVLLSPHDIELIQPEQKQIQACLSVAEWQSFPSFDLTEPAERRMQLSRKHIGMEAQTGV